MNYYAIVSISHPDFLGPINHIKKIDNDKVDSVKKVCNVFKKIKNIELNFFIGNIYFEKNKNNELSICSNLKFINTKILNEEFKNCIEDLKYIFDNIFPKFDMDDIQCDDINLIEGKFI